MSESTESKKPAPAKVVGSEASGADDAEDLIDEEPVDRSKFSQSLEEELQEDDDDVSSDDTASEQNAEDDGEGSGFRLKAPAPSRRAQSARELLSEDLAPRARNLHDRLRSHLTGTILVNVTDTKNSHGAVERYLFDWSQPEPKSGPTEQQNADCIITLRESDLMRLANGHLNPQISMLSDRMAVSGRVELAVYFFNLISPK